MTVLLVDIGNTRIKWARLNGTRLSGSRAAAHAHWRAGDYRRRLLASAAGIGAVMVASVAGPNVNRALAAATRSAGIRARFVRVPRRGGGVRVGYAEAWRLGVDRFVGAVGARALFPSVPALVVGVGTAMTLDLIDAGGRHRGGAIIPAPPLMVQTLFSQTHGIRRRARGGAGKGGGLFGRSTRDAVLQGARFAAASLIDRACEEAASLLGRTPLVILTGGGAAAVRPLVRSRAVGVPELVLRGLAVLASGPLQARR